MSEPNAVTNSSFDRFRTGDRILFEKVFTRDDFESFAELSEDRNPYHHDVEYASRQAEKGKPIVPLHMTVAPLSMIAGMNFPGEPSLYLGHEVSAIRPVHYGEILTYSARIESINYSHRVLKIRVLALRRNDVVLDATMRVQAREDNWEWAPLHEIQPEGRKTAFVTGASGEVGQAVALALARDGWDLLLQVRGDKAKRLSLEQSLAREGARTKFVAADLAATKGLNAVVEQIHDDGQIELVVHAASPPVLAPVQDHVSIGFTALKAIIDASLGQMLRRQSGAYILIGSSAVETGIPGWEAYEAGKAMATQLLRSVDNMNAAFGVTGHTIAPGLIATNFSREFRADDDKVLMPMQVADALIDLMSSRTDQDRDLILTSNRHSRGRFGFRQTGLIVGGKAVSHDWPVANEAHAVLDHGGSADTVAIVIRKILKLPDNYDLSEAGIGLIPGWDSLKHIELLLEIENAVGVRFSADEIDSTHFYRDLVALIERNQKES